MTKNLVCKFRGVEGFGVFYRDASFLSYVQQVLAGLGEEFLIGDLFGVIMPEPNLHAICGAVGYEGFFVEGGVKTYKQTSFREDANYLQVVHPRHFEERCGEFSFGGEAGLVDVLAGGFEFFGYGGD